ncbi:MAG TPA: cytochrome c [Anaerolineales bacterium]|nr:cytochrome c [Anaerolineales bacterium]
MIRKILKWIGIVLGSLIGLLVVAFVALVIIGGARANKKYDIPVETISIPTGAEAIQRGEHVARIHFCQACHAENFSGMRYFAVPGLLSIPSPNLTSGAGGVGATNTDKDWVRAIRHGVGHDGRALWIMPSRAFSHLNDGDLGALIAYLKSRPPVDNELPERRIEPIGRIMLALGMVPPLAVDQIDHSVSHVNAPEPGVTVEYGGYLVSTTCIECHGTTLNGIPFGPPGNETPTPNLTPGGELAAWSEEEFIATLRTGVTPGGHQLNERMPWKYFGQMTDDELRAVWLYLQSLPALPQGK